MIVVDLMGSSHHLPIHKSATAYDHSMLEGPTNSLLRNSPTWSVVDGPPMFINTIAVGPLALIEFCVTGGTTEAIPARCAPCLAALKLPAVPAKPLVKARRVSFVAGSRKDMLIRTEVRGVMGP